ncbi:inosine-5-monophosphate dehydrogenase [archaeon SCG-AAA382B04]|nr:inosine-5-monophosphate dehydrogenase [archaeon SCG-AAA382B04]
MGFFKVKAKDVMLGKNEVKSIRPNQKIATAKLVMSRNNIGGLPVIDENNELLGFLTLRDLHITPLSGGFEVKELMTKELVTAKPDTPIKEIAKEMIETGIQRIPIINNEGKLEGLITQTSIIKVVGNLL